MSIGIIIQLLKSDLISWWCEVRISHSTIWLGDQQETSGRAQAKKPGTNHSGQIFDESSASDIDGVIPPVA